MLDLFYYYEKMDLHMKYTAFGDVDRSIIYMGVLGSNDFNSIHDM